jgi:hypothetical protein
MRSLRQSSLRRALSMLLLTLMLALTGAPLLAAALASPASCGTNCCRSKKNCCCRKKAPPASGQGTTLVASNCPLGCGQLPALASGVLLALIPGQAGAIWALASAALLLTGTVKRCALAFAFALFGRPPPQPLPVA